MITNPFFETIDESWEEYCVIWWTKRINHVRQAVRDLRCPLTLLPSNLVSILRHMIFFSLPLGVLSRNCLCLSFATINLRDGDEGRLIYTLVDQCNWGNNEGRFGCGAAIASWASSVAFFRSSARCSAVSQLLQIGVARSEMLRMGLLNRNSFGAKPVVEWMRQLYSCSNIGSQFTNLVYLAVSPPRNQRRPISMI